VPLRCRSAPGTRDERTPGSWPPTGRLELCEGSVDLVVSLRADVGGIEKADVHVLDGTAIEAVAETTVPHDVADYSGSDPPLGRVHLGDNVEHSAKPGRTVEDLRQL
jgi:hypothetical protein